MRKELTQRWIRHGKTGTRVYRIWCNMKSRCHNKNSHNYCWYGKRGIVVCDEWRSSFSKFLADMGEPPTNTHQIDRIDSDKNYEKSNCRWVTPAMNIRNRKCNKLNKRSADIIRRSKLPAKVLAAKYGVQKNQINKIRCGAVWAR